jgi:uncharacterized protein YjbJ (UPF0337 family)
MKSGTMDKAEGKLHEVKGKVKEIAGKLINNPVLEAEGVSEKLLVNSREKSARSRRSWGSSLCCISCTGVS